jgi:hypothetical protein
MIRGKQFGIPIIYESKKAEKTIVDSRDDKKQVESQLKGYNSKVGFATNISSSIYCLAEEFPKDRKEYETLMNRLKIGRVIQGEIIDGVKGLEVPPFRNHWTKYKKITDGMTPEEKEKWEFNNKIICDIRPAFFRFLYPHYMARYNKEIRKYNLYSRLNFHKSFDELLNSKNRTPEEEKMIADYKKHSFFLDNNSVVNRISRYMYNNTARVSKYSLAGSKEFNYKVLLNTEHILDDSSLSIMRNYLQEYKSFKRNTYKDGLTYGNLDTFIAYLHKKCLEEISSNEAELADYAIQITYGEEENMVEFPWHLFSQGIIQNLLKNANGTFKFPVADENGEIEYLWNRYSLQEFPIEALYED